MGNGEFDAARERLRGYPAEVGAPPVQAVALAHAVFTAPGAPPADVLAALIVLRHLRDELGSWEPHLIAAARDQGVSWAELAPALGVASRQAAERRYLRLRPSADDQHTGEQRVAAERTKRAGDRAVAAWAKQNSSELRQLAGQVSALEGLADPAKEHIHLVHEALADNNPASLLGPLADSHSHLMDTHSALAEQIKSVTEHTEQLRRDTHEQRSTAQDH